MDEAGPCPRDNNLTESPPGAATKLDEHRPPRGDVAPRGQPPLSAACTSKAWRKMRSTRSVKLPTVVRSTTSSSVARSLGVNRKCTRWPPLPPGRRARVRGGNGDTRAGAGGAISSSCGQA